MKKMKKILHKRGFQFKILVMGIVCSLIAVMMTASGVLVVTNHATNTLSRDLISKLSGQISLNVDSTVSQVQSLLFNITLDQNVLEILKRSDANQGQISNKDAVFLQSKIMQAQIVRGDIHGLYLFDSRGNSYYAELSPSLKRAYHIQNEPWYDDLNKINGIMLFGNSVPERYLNDNTQVVTLVQRYANIQNNRTLATIIVDIRLSAFDSIMKSLGLSPEYCVLILDDQNKLIYSNYETEIENTIAGDLYKQFLAENSIESEDGDMYVSQSDEMFWESTKSLKTGWTVVCGATVTDISGIGEMVRPMAFGLVAFITLLTVIVLSLITKRQFRSLNVLRGGMDKVKQGEFGLHIPVNGDDEISDLGSSFNEMTDRLNDLMSTVAKLEYEKQEVKLCMAQAELRALQAQINPHFIYNTLESISMLAEINDDDEVQMMATSLGKLLRISITGSSLVTLREELEYIENYMLIQRIRFDKRIRMNIDVDEVLLNCIVPKLILQPIVENSINHGLEESVESETIEIKGNLIEGNIILIVSDNGKGMSKQVLERVQRMVEDCTDSHEDDRIKHHVGLSNVNQRIRLRYQNEIYGLKIQSEVGRGTSIFICLPADTQPPEDASAI